MTSLIMTADKIGLHGLANWFKRLAASIAHRRAISSTIKQLSALTDHELNDIGISRGEIYDIAHRIDEEDHTVERNKNLKGWV